MNKKTFANTGARELKNKINSRGFLTAGFTPLEIEYPMACREDNRQNNLANGGLSPFKDKFLTGFTLMELLVYTAIFVVAAAFMTGIMITTLRVGQHESASAEVTDQLNFVMQTISRLTKESSAIIVNGTSNDTSLDGAIGNAYPRLILRMKDSNGGVSDRDPIVIWNNNGVINESEGAGANQKTNILTNSKVNADNLQFTKFTQYPGHDTVSINLQLSYKSQNPSSQFTKTLQSAIARVSAATFDADVLPGASSYNLGQNNSPWQNIYMKQGSANSPSYTFDRSYDPTSIVGMFNPSANVLGFSTNGTERMRIDNNGYVGIGTTTPATILEAQAPTSGATNTSFRGASNNGQKYIDLNIQNDGTANFGGNFTNFGIGTTAPLAKLHSVQAGGNVDPSLTYNSTAAYILNTAGVDLAMGVLTASPWSYWLQARSWGNAALPISLNPSGGNVGIGTTAPTYNLDVAGVIHSTGDIYISKGASPFIGSTNIQDLRLGTNLTERMRIGANGNVGIGTAAPTQALDVNGNASISGNLKAGGANNYPVYECPVYILYGVCNNPCIGQLQRGTTCNRPIDIVNGSPFCGPTAPVNCTLVGRLVQN